MVKDLDDKYEIVEKIDFVNCSNCNGTIFKAQLGRDIWVVCENCRESSQLL